MDELGAYYLYFYSTEYGSGIVPANDDNRAPVTFGALI